MPFKDTMRRTREEARTRIVFTQEQRNDIRIPIILAIAPQLGGWSDMFAYVSIRDAYLPGFKILPSVQFSTRMWHVAILVTSGLCRTIYWPPSAARTIYLPSPIFPFVLTITRYLFFLRRFFLFPLPSSHVLSFFLPLSFSIPTVAYDRVESTLERYRLSTWYLKLSTPIFCDIDIYRTTNSWPCE